MYSNTKQLEIYHQQEHIFFKDTFFENFGDMYYIFFIFSERFELELKLCTKVLLINTNLCVKFEIIT